MIEVKLKMYTITDFVSVMIALKKLDIEVNTPVYGYRSQSTHWTKFYEQVKNLFFEHDELTVGEIARAIDLPISYKTVQRKMMLLEEKGLVTLERKIDGKGNRTIVRCLVKQSLGQFKEEKN